MSAIAFYRLAGKKIKELVQPYGFKKNGRFFYRITEEGIVQQFCLLWLHHSFTVRFYLSSIYSDNGKDIEGAEIYEIINGSVNQWLSESCSDFVITTNNFVLDAANLCTQAVQNTLLPFFELHRDPVSARNFITGHSPRITQGLDKYDIRELGLFLSLGDVSSVRDFLEYHIEHCDRYNKHWWNGVEQEYRHILAAIDANDKEYLSLYMDDKRNKTYSEYKWKNEKQL